MGIIEKIAVDDATLARLAADAKRRGRTVEQEAAEALRAGIGPMSRDEFIRQADEIASLTHRGISQTDSVTLLREDRDR